jgi:hypothetical protein
MSQIARQLGLSVTAISQPVERGKRIATEDNFSLDVRDFKRRDVSYISGSTNRSSVVQPGRAEALREI